MKIASVHYKIKNDKESWIQPAVCGTKTNKWIDDKEKFLNYKNACSKCKNILNKLTGDTK